MKIMEGPIEQIEETSLEAEDSSIVCDRNGEKLFHAAKLGDAAAVNELLLAGADPTWTQPQTLLTPLMMAAESGNAECVVALLQAGAPWNAQDKDGCCAGEYASGEVLHILLDWAVQAELILGTIAHAERKKRPEESRTSNLHYLQSSLRFEEGRIIDADGEAVMMGWEKPLMERHADVLFEISEGRTDCSDTGKDVLNIGFGLGIIDEEIQKRNPKSHTIIEAHPDIYKHMCALGWDKKPGVNIVFGRWQDVLPTLGPFDSIFFDTYGEYFEDMKDLHVQLPSLLRPGGIYSFFNGLAPDNIFFHMVYGEIARRELNALGFAVKYDAMAIDASADSIWEGIANRYWHLPYYFLPICKLEKKD